MGKEKRFEGRTAMVTGGAGDIGRTTALRLAAEGAAIALVDIKRDGLQNAQREIAETGVRVEIYECDVRTYDTVARMVGQAAMDFGRLDFLFNNAGYQGVFKPTHEYPADDFEQLIQINVNGAFFVLKAVSEHMVASGGGSIVNTASMAGVGGPPNMIAYGASKFAVVGMTQSAAKDLAPHNIRVNAISPAFMGPGFMWDRQVALQAAAGTQYFSSDPATVAEQMIGSVPMRRCGSINEIPGAVVFFMSDDAGYITGVNLPIAGGIL